MKGILDELNSEFEARSNFMDKKFTQFESRLEIANTVAEMNTADITALQELEISSVTIEEVMDYISENGIIVSSRWNIG